MLKEDFIVYHSPTRKNELIFFLGPESFRDHDCDQRTKSESTWLFGVEANHIGVSLRPSISFFNQRKKYLRLDTPLTRCMDMVTLSIVHTYLEMFYQREKDVAELIHFCAHRFPCQAVCCLYLPQHSWESAFLCKKCMIDALINRTILDAQSLVKHSFLC